MSLNIPLVEVNHEEKLLENLFVALGQLKYDKAKEILDREISNRRSSVVNSSWGTILSSLLHLPQAEKSYMNLTYLQKGFLKKEPPRCGYESFRSELLEFRVGGNSDLENVLVHLSRQLVDFASARIRMCDLYEKTCSMGRNVNYTELLEDLTNVKKNLCLSFHHPTLAPLHSVFSLEVELFEELLKAITLVQQWLFFESLQRINSIHNKMQTWEEILKKQSRRASFSSGLFSAGASTVWTPPLIQWMGKLKLAILSKFSLYFYDVLAKQAPENVMKSLCSKNSIDYVARIQSFMKKSECLCVCLVLDVSGMSDYKGFGYHVPTVPSLSLTGLDAYPPVVSFPADILKDSQKCRHWPSVVMLMTNCAVDLSAMDKVVSFYDNKACCTYFLSRVDPLVTLVGIWENRRNEKDTNVTQFFQDISVQLRCNRILMQLKPGMKGSYF